MRPSIALSNYNLSASLYVVEMSCGRTRRRSYISSYIVQRLSANQICCRSHGLNIHVALSQSLLCFEVCWLKFSKLLTTWNELWQNSQSLIMSSWPRYLALCVCYSPSQTLPQFRPDHRTVKYPESKHLCTLALMTSAHAAPISFLVYLKRPLLSYSIQWLH